jgi:hypothetical protein
MSFLRSLVLGLSNLLLGLYLFLLATTITLMLTIASPAFIKSTLDKSGFYKNIVSSGLKLASVQASDPTNFDSQIIDKLTPTIKEVLNPTFLQTNAEQLIDGFGHWASDKVNAPDFSLDTAALRANLNQQLAVFLSQQLSELPNCPKNNDVSSYDLMTTACNPPIVLSQADFIKAADGFTANIPLINQNQLSFKDFDTKGAAHNNKTWQKIPTGYKILSYIPLISGVLSIISIVLIIILSRNRIRGWRVVGHAFIVAGGILLVSGSVTLFFLSRNIISFTNGASSEQIAFAKDIFMPISHLVAVGFGNFMLYFGTGYCVGGAACYFIAHRLRLKQLHHQEPDSLETSSLEIPETIITDPKPLEDDKPPIKPAIS